MASYFLGALRLEWLTVFPAIFPLPQTSQTLLITHSPFIVPRQLWHFGFFLGKLYHTSFQIASDFEIFFVTMTNLCLFLLDISFGRSFISYNESQMSVPKFFIFVAILLVKTFQMLYHYLNMGAFSFCIHARF